MDENIENDTASFEKKCIAAYYLWLARGCGNGYDKADWFAAEALLKLSPAVRSNAYPPSYSYINTATIRSSLSNPYFDTNRFFLPTNTWIEISVAPETIFEYDRNRKLFFEEGFLCASYRIFNDQSLNPIVDNPHFRYTDLCQCKAKISTLKEMYKKGIYLSPPLFYYSDYYQLQILDGVHRIIALYELAHSKDNTTIYAQNGARIRVGFNHLKMSADKVAHQLWINYADRNMATVSVQDKTAITCQNL